MRFVVCAECCLCAAQEVPELFRSAVEKAGSLVALREASDTVEGEMSSGGLESGFPGKLFEMLP